MAKITCSENLLNTWHRIDTPIRYWKDFSSPFCLEEWRAPILRWLLKVGSEDHQGYLSSPVHWRIAWLGWQFSLFFNAQCSKWFCQTQIDSRGKKGCFRHQVWYLWMSSNAFWFDRCTLNFFQRTMTNLLQWYIVVFALHFIDDILSFSQSKKRTSGTHPFGFRGLSFEESTVLRWRSVSFLSQCLLSWSRNHLDGLLPSQGNVEKLLMLRPPRNRDEVMAFLGSASYYRRFAPNYAKIVTSLMALLPKNKNFSWDAE